MFEGLVPWLLRIGEKYLKQLARQLTQKVAAEVQVDQNLFWGHLAI